MCGISAILSYHPAARPVDRDELGLIHGAMKRRGPDGEGVWYSADGTIGLAHRRLAIIDLSPGGAQPMATADGRFRITFNGEIYNYKELRAELLSRGVPLRTQSDTEVILEMFASSGPECLRRLRGMFAFALWDERERRLLLARDPFGIKPLYYSDDGWSVRVASQVKALLAGGAVSRDVEPAGVAGFCLTGSVPEPDTIYRDIRQVPAGAWLAIDSAGPHPAVPFSRLNELFVRNGRKGALAVEQEAAEAFEDSVKAHLVADVPVGAFLSAGIDSSALVALARAATTAPLHTVTLAFEEFRNRPEDEAPLAAETARRLGTEHRTVTIGRGEFEIELPRVLDCMDQPTVDGVNSYFVSRAAAAAGLKVALSGLGGDELLGGYPTFQGVPWIARSSAVASRVPGLGRLARSLLSPMLPSSIPPRYAGLFEPPGAWAGAWLLRRGLFAPWELPDLLGPELAREGLRRLDLGKRLRRSLEPDPGTAFSRVSLLEASGYMRNQLLRDADWASMSHSLEVRVPLVDPVLWKRLTSLLGTGPRSKSLLARAPRPALPDSVAGRPKTGFGIPIWEWVAGSRAFDEWRAVPLLRRPGPQGPRRWAWTVLSRQIPGLAGARI